jgi:hypothetical protein
MYNMGPIKGNIFVCLKILKLHIRFHVGLELYLFKLHLAIIRLVSIVIENLISDRILHDISDTD